MKKALIELSELFFDLQALSAGRKALSAELSALGPWPLGAS